MIFPSSVIVDPERIVLDGTTAWWVVDGVINSRTLTHRYGADEVEWDGSYRPPDEVLALDTAERFDLIVPHVCDRCPMHECLALPTTYQAGIVRILPVLEWTGHAHSPGVYVNNRSDAECGTPAVWIGHPPTYAGICPVDALVGQYVVELMVRP